MDPRDIRPSAIAGSWYPGEPRELARSVDAFLTRANESLGERLDNSQLVALIAPHAGHAYSGQTAAHAYAQLLLRDQKFDTVVLIGPSHHADFGAYAISAKKFYATPLGQVELDQDFISTLEKKSIEPHTGVGVPVTRVEHDKEHSLEIQLPFLQRVLGNFKLVPIMMSRPFYVIGPEARIYCDQLANALANTAAHRNTLFVASSDLSHLEDYNAVKKFDARFAQLIEQFDVDALADYMWRTGQCRACGDAPIITTLLAAKHLGADRVRILHQTNSGDVTGEREQANYIVGYLAAAVYKSQK